MLPYVPRLNSEYWKLFDVNFTQLSTVGSLTVQLYINLDFEKAIL